MNQRLITFRMFARYCAYRQFGCNHAGNHTNGRFDNGKCSEKNCPAWRGLRKPAAAEQGKEGEGATHGCITCGKEIPWQRVHCDQCINDVRVRLRLEQSAQQGKEGEG